MNPEGQRTWSVPQINNDVTRTFERISESGWANHNDGNVEAPTGWFALVNIEPNELDELISAVEEEMDELVTVYPGHYILQIDSDGNKTVTEFLTKQSALQSYNMARREFAIWDITDCPECYKSDCLENVTMEGAEKRCVACGHAFAVASLVEDVKI